LRNFIFDSSIYNTIQLKFRGQNKKDEVINMQIDKYLDILKEYRIECYNSWIEEHKSNNNDNSQH